jgi:hypothetical protein
MRIIGFHFFLLFIFFLITACNSNDGNSNIFNGSRNSNKELVEKNNNKPPVEEAKTEKPTKTKDINSLVPSGWGVLIKGEPVIAKGDLNKDGIMDIAAIIEQVTSETEGAPQRALLIAFGTMKESCSLSIIADKVILKADEEAFGVIRLKASI